MHMGHGARLCMQLYNFISGLIDITTGKQPFVEFLPHSFPDWLPKLFDIQSEIRTLQFTLAAMSHLLTTINEFKETVKSDQYLYAILNNNSIVLIRERDYSKGSTVRERNCVSRCHAPLLDGMNDHASNSSKVYKTLVKDLMCLQYQEKSLSWDTRWLFMT